MWPFRRASELPMGQRGERLARGFLKRAGCKILAANYRCPSGEADLIVLDPSTRKHVGAETIAFVEVKTRTSDRYTDPASAVNAAKQRTLRKIANYYLAGRDTDAYRIRFDIVSIIIPPDQKPRITHIPDAF